MNHLHPTWCPQKDIQGAEQNLTYDQRLNRVAQTTRCFIRGDIKQESCRKYGKNGMESATPLEKVSLGVHRIAQYGAASIGLFDDRIERIAECSHRAGRGNHQQQECTYEGQLPTPTQLDTR